MNTLIHADIFFFISTIATIALTLLLVVILFYIARTARTVSQMVEQIKKESGQVLNDLSDLREKIKDSGSQVSGFGKWFASLLFGKAVNGVFKSAKSAHSAGGASRKASSTRAKDQGDGDMR